MVTTPPLSSALPVKTPPAAPTSTTGPSTPGDARLLEDLLAERFPTAAQVRAEARRPVPAPALIVRGRSTVSVDTMRRDAEAAIRFDSRRQAADARRIEDRIAAARKIVVAARRKAG